MHGDFAVQLEATDLSLNRTMSAISLFLGDMLYSYSHISLP